MALYRFIIAERGPGLKVTGNCTNFSQYCNLRIKPILLHLLFLGASLKPTLLGKYLVIVPCEDSERESRLSYEYHSSLGKVFNKKLVSFLTSCLLLLPFKLTSLDLSAVLLACLTLVYAPARGRF